MNHDCAGRAYDLDKLPLSSKQREKLARLEAKVTLSTPRRNVAESDPKAIPTVQQACDCILHLSPLSLFLELELVYVSMHFEAFVSSAQGFNGAKHACHTLCHVELRQSIAKVFLRIVWSVF